MPTKKKPATPAKKGSSRKVLAKPAAKSATVKSSSPKARATRPSPQESIWTKPYFLKEQQEFYAKHPNSKVLLALFIAATLLFLYIVWVNKFDLYPGLIN